MQVHISFDYELFFGSFSGTAEKCMLMPAMRLMDIAKKHGVPFIFFVDAGYLVQLKKHAHIEACKITHEKVAEQLKQLVAQGHEIGLHIHPHWEDCTFENNRWTIDTTRYKLADFSAAETEAIITTYHKAIIDIIGRPCKSYRAGGWCIQPFAPIKKALVKNNIFIDSTVYYNGSHLSAAHSYDFRMVSDKEQWRFDNDPCIENTGGDFTEIAISPDVIPPLFYWKMYFNMRTNPAVYKPVGDGLWLSDRKRIYRHFHSFTNHFACCDGFFASRLNTVLKSLEKRKKQRMMILGHPKSMANYSFDALDRFIGKAIAKGHTISTISGN